MQGSVRKLAALLATGLLAMSGGVIAHAAPPSPVATAKVPAPAAGARCNDLYFGYFPGPLDFCLGLQAWKHAHYDSAINWFKLAAGWGSKGAQFTLGLIYYQGNQVARDPALGLAWLELANERHNQPQIEAVAHAAHEFAPPDERRRADRLLQTMRTQYADKVAARRAWKQYDHWAKLVTYTLGGMLGGALDADCVVYLPGKRMETCAEAKAERNELATRYFAGWAGHVAVEPLRPAKTPPSSAH